MIIQTLDQGVNKIRIENAESLEDAEKNNFKVGEYSRYFINDKPVASYMTMIKFIMEETKKNNKSFVPNTKDLIEQRKKMLTDQKNMMKKQLEDVKKAYGNMGSMGEAMLGTIDGMIEKLNESGIRVRQ
jgi:hypothetical protein